MKIWEKSHHCLVLFTVLHMLKRCERIRSSGGGQGGLLYKYWSKLSLGNLGIDFSHKRHSLQSCLVVVQITYLLFSGSETLSLPIEL